MLIFRGGKVPRPDGSELCLAWPSFEQMPVNEQSTGRDSGLRRSRKQSRARRVLMMAASCFSFFFPPRRFQRKVKGASLCARLSLPPPPK